MLYIFIFKIIFGLLFMGLYGAVKGLYQGYYYHNKIYNAYSPTKENLHPYYFKEAVGVAFLLTLITWHTIISINIWSQVVIVLANMVALGGIFLFTHDGVYYSTRNNLNPDIYKLRWKDHGDDTAKLDIDWKTRKAWLTVTISLSIIEIILIW